MEYTLLINGTGTKQQLIESLQDFVKQLNKKTAENPIIFDDFIIEATFTEI